MRLVYSIADVYEYSWTCSMCFSTAKINFSSPLLGINFIKFDVAVELWTHNCNSR
jgi:hypothetical protein